MRGVEAVIGSRDASESVADRARRALQDNDGTKALPLLPAGGGPFPPPPADQDPAVATEPSAAPKPPPSGPATLPDIHLVTRRVEAINLTRGLEPRLRCCRDLVRELSQRLGQTATDSVHYEGLLARLRKAHAELRWLETQMEEAQHVIRSTEWLVEMLADPLPAWKGPGR
jgi:hypothetical protein